MDSNLQILSKEIDKLRSKLYQLILSKSLTDNEVVNYSQELDKLLVKYHNVRKLLKRVA
jgi:hypothetical protein